MESKKTKLLDKLKTIISSISRRNKYLDIGAGNGHITKQIAEYYDCTEIIEPDKKFHKNYDSIKNKIVYECDLQNFNTCKKYDLIICSHAMYYIPEEEWTSMIKKIYNMLEPTGICIFVSISNDGKYKNFLDTININHPTSKNLLEKLNDLNYRYSVTSHDVLLKTQSKEKSLDIIKYFVIGDCFDIEEQKNISDFYMTYIDSVIDEYVESCKDKDNFVLNFSEDIIVCWLISY